MDKIYSSKPILVNVVLLTLITAGAHLYLSTLSSETLNKLFLLNGLGYIGILLLYILPHLEKIHQHIKWLFIGYTALTIILWIFLSGAIHGELDPFDLTVKAVELTLVIQLLFT